MSLTVPGVIRQCDLILGCWFSLCRLTAVDEHPSVSACWKSRGSISNQLSSVTASVTRTHRLIDSMCVPCSVFWRSSLVEILSQKKVCVMHVISVVEGRKVMNVWRKRHQKHRLIAHKDSILTSHPSAPQRVHMTKCLHQRVQIQKKRTLYFMRASNNLKEIYRNRCMAEIMCLYWHHLILTQF